MKCPQCECQEDKVIDSRVSKEGACVRRRRECINCNHRFTTVEEVVPAEIYVIKRDGNREEFNPSKIRKGLQQACWKRPIRNEQLDALMMTILPQIEQLDAREVSSEAIGLVVMEALQHVDEVAYVRFASVYRQFRDIEQFINEIRQLNTQL